MKKMHVGMVTRWAQDCGIATYAEQLVNAFERSEHEIYSTVFSSVEAPRRKVAASAQVHQVWVPYDPRNPYGSAGNADAIVSAAKASKVDLLHIQHEEGLWPRTDHLIETFRAARDAGIPVVLTLHTVWHYADECGRAGWYDQIRQLTQGIIVHTPPAYASVLLGRGPGPVYCVAHGTPEEVAGDPNRGREILQLEQLSSKVAIGLVFGFASPRKNVAGTILAFAAGYTRRYFDNSVLVIAGQEKLSAYFVELEYLASRVTGCGDVILLRPGFVPVNDVRHVMAAADYGVLNTQATELSASGQVHAYAAHGVPLAVANRPIYHEAVEAGAVPFESTESTETPYGVTSSMITAVSAMARSRPLRARTAACLRSYGQRTAWSRLVPTYRKIYERAAGVEK